MPTNMFSDKEQSESKGSSDAAGRSASSALLGLTENLRIRRLLEEVIERLDKSGPLNKVGQTLAGLTGKVIKPGKVKDLVSGTWLGHPAHPMLTDLPIGFWTSSFMLDVVGGEKARPASDALIGMGVLAALPTAVTGLSDLADVSEDEGLRIGTAHALGNSAALICYTLSLAARRNGNRQAGLVWSTAGAGLATVGGYLGGHMAYRRGIGVNQTAFEKPVDDWTDVAVEGDLEEGEPQMVTLEGDDIFLLRQSGKLCAMANRCSHRGGPLNEGEIRNGTVICPWHGSTFNLTDGSVVAGPATAPQPAYEARIVDGRVEVRSRR